MRRDFSTGCMRMGGMDSDRKMKYFENNYCFSLAKLI